MVERQKAFETLKLRSEFKREKERKVEINSVAVAVASYLYAVYMYTCVHRVTIAFRQ